MATLAEAFVKVRADVSKVGDDIKKGVTPAAESAGKATGGGFAKSFLKATAVLSAGGAVVSFFKGSISEGIEAQKVGAQTTAVLKSTGGAAGVTAKQIGDLANAISAKTGVDDEAIQSNENLLLTFTNIKNEVGKGNDVFNQATLAVSDMSAALGQDGKSSAIQLGKALNDPIKGITALQRVGVSFTDQQKEQIKTLVKSGNTLGAQKIILGEVQKEFGGSAAAIATPGEKMNVAWKNLQETVGLKLLPVLAKLSAILIPVFTFIANNLPTVGAFVATILVLVGALKVWSIWQAIVNEELTLNPIGIVVVAIAALVAGIVYLATRTQFFQTVWHAVWGGIKTAFAAVMGFLRGNLTGLVLLILGPVGALAYLALHWKTVWNGIKTAFNATVHFLRGLLADLVGAVLGMFGSIVHGAATAFGWIPGIGGKLKTAARQFDSFAKGVEASIRGIPNTVPIHIKVNFTGSALAAGYLGHHAGGGRIGGSGWSIVGEQGPELIYAPGAMVKSNAESKRIASLGGWSGGGGDGIHVHLHNSVIASEKQFEDMLVKAYNAAKRNRRIRIAT